MPALFIALFILLLVLLRVAFLKQRLLSAKKTRIDGEEEEEEEGEDTESGALWWRCAAIVMVPVSLIDRGMLKVGWSTIQILSTIPWNLSVNFPAPFEQFLSASTFTQLDFSSVGCLVFKVSFFFRVLLTSLTPIGLIIFDYLVYLLRLFFFKRAIVTARDLHFKNEEEQVQMNKKKKRASVIVSMTEVFTPSLKKITETTDLDHLSWDNFDLVALQIRRIETKIANQHIYFALLLSYLVLPSVSMIQFNALDCLKIGDALVLTTDTSIDCESDAYREFFIANLLIIFIYQSVPLIWFLMLWRIRHKLNPTNASAARALAQHANQAHTSAHESAAEAAGLAAASASTFITVIEARNADVSLRHLAFLWQDYKPASWYYEVVEIYRRVAFTAVLPVLAAPGVLRVSLGCLLSIATIAMVREVEPFLRGGTNVLLTISAYQILVTFLAALILITDSLDSLHLSEFFIGTILVFVNFVIVGVAASSLIWRFRAETRIKKWKRKFNDQEVSILLRVMEEHSGNGFNSNNNNDDDGSDDGGSDLEFTSNVMRRKLSSMMSPKNIEMTKQVKSRESVGDRVLRRHLLKAKDISLHIRIGVGAFGEVFKGKCLGEVVAVKTMLDVTEENVRSFKHEILINSNLRHPNVVHFVGACWGRELTCLVMEWVSRGSLSIILGDITLSLKWDEPLLRLATDVARGLEYLHSCRYFDETYGDFKECILHRDLKPDNVLVTDFLRGKLTDFGSSRAKGSAQMTAVGTPLFCAPEVIRGDSYDESIDVYSFGLLLLDMAVQGGLVAFCEERFATQFGGTRHPSVMKLVRTMVEKKWRPMNNSDRKVPGSPPLINAMIEACLHPDPSSRPNISQIVHDLQESCSDEISLGSYGRWVVGGSNLTMESSPAIVEEKARNSVALRLGHLSVHSRLSNSSILVPDGLNEFRKASINQRENNSVSATAPEKNNQHIRHSSHNISPLTQGNDSGILNTNSDDPEALLNPSDAAESEDGSNL